MTIHQHHVISTKDMQVVCQFILWFIFMSLLLSIAGNHTALAITLCIFTFVNVTLGFVFYKFSATIITFITPITSFVTTRIRITLVADPDKRQWLQDRGRWLYQRPVLVYSVCMLMWFAPLAISQHVISPFRPTTYANLEPNPQATYTETTFFSDFLVAYIPEINLQQQTPRAGWIGLWTNNVEFGRPLSQSGIFASPAYVINLVILPFIHNEYIYFTVFFVSLIYLTGLFGLLYAHDLSGIPGVALLVGLLLAFTPSFFFWNTFPMFIAPTTWGIALFYGLHRIRYQASANWSILLVAFAVYSLIYTAYPQLIINLAYVSIGYFCWQLWQVRSNFTMLKHYISSCGLAVGIGVILALPFLLDLITTSKSSLLRQQITPQFFIGVVPNIATIKQLLVTLFSFGLSDVLQPITTFTKSTYPIQAGYITFSLFIFVCIGICTQWRNVWGWVVWLFVAAAFSFRQDLFAFGYFHGLPQLSRGLLFGGSSQHIPLLFLVLYGLYSIFTKPPTHTRLIALITAGAGLQYIVLTITYACWQQIPIQWPFVGIELLVLCGVTLAILLPQIAWKTVILSAVVLCSAQFSLRPLLLTQPMANIITTSPTAAAIATSLPPDGLMASINVKPTFIMEPNFSSVLNVKQIGTYSSLQSIYYVNLMKRFNVNYDTYLRTVRSINPPLPANDVWMTNIRTIVSDKPLTLPGLIFLKRVNGSYLYHTADGMGCCLQVPISALRNDTMATNHLWLDNPQAPTNQRLTKKVDLGDEFTLEFPAQIVDSVIVFNQQFHPDWVAHVQKTTGWQPTTTVVINDVYQAVHIPAGATALNFQFRPWIRWSIVVNLFWLTLGGIWLYSKITRIYQARKTFRFKDIMV